MGQSILRSFPLSSTVKIVLTKYVVIIIRIVNVIRDNLESGQH